MAAANPVAEYLLTEGAGLVINDSVGNNNLALILRGDDSWLAGAGRGGISSTEIGGAGGAVTALSASIRDIATNGSIGSSFANATQMSIVLVIEPLALASSKGENLFRLGVDGPAWGDVEIVHGSGITLQWGRAGDTGGGSIAFQNYSLLDGAQNSPFVVILTIDTSQELLENRARAWYNTTEIPQAVSQSAPVLEQGTTLGAVNNTDRNMYFLGAGNTTNAAWYKNVNANLFYAKVFTGVLTPAQAVTYATNLLINADVDGSVTPEDVTAPVIILPTGAETGSDTATGTISTDTNEGLVYWEVTTNAVELKADVIAANQTQAVSATGIQTVNATGLANAADLYFHFVHVDDTGNESDVSSSAVFTTYAASVFSANSLTAGTIRPGDSFDINLSGATNATGKTVTSSAGAFTVTSQDINKVTVTCVDPVTFGNNTLPFGAAIQLTVADGGDTATIDLTISPPVGTSFGQVISKDVDGAYANDGLVVSDYVYFELLSGDAIFDVATGLSVHSVVSTGRYAAYDTSWSGYAALSWEAPVGVVNQAPVVTAPADRSFEFANGGAGLAHNDAALIAHLATATVSDDTDTLTLNNPLLGLPDPLTANTYTLTFTTTDTDGATGSDSMLLTVAEADAVVVDSPPIFTSNGVTLVIVGNQYSHTPTATDSDGDAVVITVPVIPSWMTFVNGDLSGDSSNVTPGNYAVTLRATANGLTVDQSFNVVVSEFVPNVVAPYGRCVAIGDSGKTFEVDPSDLSDYWLLWGDKLGSDQISSLVVSVTGDLVVTTQEVISESVLDDIGATHSPNSVVSLWLSGGTAGMAYQITITVDTLGGRRWQRSFNVFCIEL